MATLIEVNGRKIRADLIEQGRTMGRSEGIAQGIARGRAAERDRLRRERERLRRELSALPLAPEMAARVSKLLDPAGDPRPPSRSMA